MTINALKVGLYIQKMRKTKNLTQNQLAERLTISYQAISKWERGETLPDTAILVDLAMILETTVDNTLNGGEPIMNFTKKIFVKDIKTGIDNLSTLGSLIGKDNTIYKGLVEGINSKMNIDVEECFADSFKKEALIAEIIVQDLMNGAYVDVSDANNYLENEHWREVVKKYALKYDIK